MSMAYEEYMRQLVVPMRRELTGAGFEELTTAEEVENFMKKAEGTTLVVVNSVCGCAAGLARPAATQAVLQNDKTPDNTVTVFAGQDKEATAKMREYFTGQEPSSPSMALLKGTEVVHFIPRHEIEGHEMEEIMKNLTDAFDAHC
ncbi:BrxA/BrxB family bacilliredoxin [Bacillus halotolerans]|uniref:bacilliredoxin BrxA n=1 Tax=Bacillus halotolerans TaxID=260554 RepID=UPI000D014DB2|nr:bacilliredoxin BrxA [Bacillus halotolerans]PRP50160.1 BrxA/BrxB family bacilliredoxin [Bacillus halotolerans]PRP53838.1 BrxA/BrxB family bacilliredoxin [Bacillus halotolerans]PRP58582.1 BrxA/BrxB family bacilliredoxin [Bacillus halotolerans]PRP63521.1 BrxA/BrxB family bacilliredoxin [Bacillus halotolerans]